MFSTIDTIVAVATPAGRGGIGVVRLSGPDAPAIACRLLDRKSPLEARRATFGQIRDGADPLGRPVDQVVATWFQAPHSYTSEDVVEVTAHGNPVLLERIVELAIGAGARLAGPGEFTYRAYLHGRLDLVQAEAVLDLVEAVTPLQARAAMDQLEGTLTARVQTVSASLFDLAARLEASLDFPEEGFHFITRQEAVEELASCHDALERLAASGRAGRLLRDGSTVVIAGRPNAGKSSLFNALAGVDRAIVTAVPGTTRDVLTERIDINGLPVTVVDTAGLREAEDAIEAEGIRRAQDARRVAALTLLVVDPASPGALADVSLPETVAGGTLVVLSKADRHTASDLDRLRPEGVASIAVSAITGAGLAELRHQIVSLLTGRDDWRDPPAISNIRHLTHVREALEALGRAVACLRAGGTEELVLAEMATARLALESITGQTSSEDLLRHIFGKFCVGK